MKRSIEDDFTFKLGVALIKFSIVSTVVAVLVRVIYSVEK